ncbi:MAG: DNA polymerase IV, partial [Chloroflexi bacterium]|nr:DNA polymerase IV [Chloroflexota bacterium]
MGRRTGYRDEKAEAIKRLQSLCNVGPVTAERLYSLGIETPEQMKQS